MNNNSDFKVFLKVSIFISLCIFVLPFVAYKFAHCPKPVPRKHISHKKLNITEVRLLCMKKMIAIDFSKIIPSPCVHNKKCVLDYLTEWEQKCIKDNS